MKTINWSDYNNKLIKQGQVTIWISKDVEKNWYCKRAEGGSFTNLYSDLAIETLLMIKFFYKLTFRQCQGFGQSIIKLMGLNIQVPDYTTLSRRLKKLGIEVDKIKKHQKVHLVLDSTGLKVYGEGEWKVRKHGYSKRRTWRKLHLAVDEGNNNIVAAELTGNEVADCEVIKDLFKDLNIGDVDQVSADGAYDTNGCYNEIENLGAEPVIPPRKGAVITQHGNSAKDPLKRDENIRGVRKYGMKDWKVNSHYHRRSLAETAMFRFKTHFGSCLSSRLMRSQKNEAMLKVKMLNMMATPNSL